MKPDQTSANLSLEWGEEFLASPSSAIAFPVEGPETEGRAVGADLQWRSWQGRLRSDLLAASCLYGIAHGAIGLHRIYHASVLGAPLLLSGILLFLLGTGLLWRALRALNEPLAARYPNAARIAGRCLALVMGLAFTPCLWIFLIWTR